MNLSDTLRAAAEVYEPDDAWGLLGLLVVNGAAILAAIGSLISVVVTVRGQKRGRRRWSHDREKLDEIHEETVNSHKGKTNMRDQIDALEQKVDLIAVGVTALQQGQETHNVAIRDLKRDVGGIREELRTERKERIAGDARGGCCQ
ncbi:hypothetical protein KD930_gp29 [Mycobacterium phage Kevin1]|uniref:Minor tail protein n=1 Tax=Mycobacterium phage Kevin1 TaxID=2530132 RepID=A0A481VUD2_9CAUD|nr:hypothetical protein KD930_gp29 [Mycobacterium phage Kevin1]QBI97273.1 hypothetical protein SEA_KEVIN1_29 [Mycobacterium phage Kevin1]